MGCHGRSDGTKSLVAGEAQPWLWLVEACIPSISLWRTTTYGSRRKGYGRGTTQ